MRCAAVRKRGSTEQCTAPRLNGCSFCGRHARCKPDTVVIWASLYKDRNSVITRFQALVRGWFVRRRLKLAGPGVLSRKTLMNDEDLETLEPKDREHPFTYFGFEEAGKIWWFHFPTLWKWALRSAEPTNPYTKVVLSRETRIRLRAMWAYNRRHKLPLPEEPYPASERTNGRWNILLQMFQDYGYGTLHSEHHLRLRRLEYVNLFTILRRDLNTLYPETSRIRQICVGYCNRGIRIMTNLRYEFYVLQSVYALLLMAMTPKDPYELAFIILSAIYRC